MVDFAKASVNSCVQREQSIAICWPERPVGVTASGLQHCQSQHPAKTVSFVNLFCIPCLAQVRIVQAGTCYSDTCDQAIQGET